MAIIRAKQGVITRVLPHQGNRRYLIPGGMRGYPLGAGGITPTLDFNFAADKSLVANIGPTLTCTRSGDATYFDASGVMQTAGTNTARFDHDPGASNASLGLLIEEERTNQCTYSEDFNGADWVAGHGNTRDSDAGTAPDGTTTADRLNVTATDERHNFSNFWSAGIAASTTYTASCFFKADGDDYACLNMISNQIRGAHAVFTLTGDGTVTEAEAVGTGTYVDSGIENVGNGWYRCWLAFTVGTSSDLYFTVSAAGSATPAAYINGSPDYLAVEGEDILMWGAQLEIGAFPTSYIPTTTASVTRAADVVSTTTVDWLDAAGTEVGTFFSETSFPYAGNPISGIILQVDDGTNTDRVLIYRATGEVINGFTVPNTGNQGSFTDAGGTRSANTAIKSAFGYALNDVNGAVDGVLGTPDTTATLPITDALTTLRVGSDSASALQHNGHIARIVYYDSRLTDTQLQDLSNGTFP